MVLLLAASVSLPGTIAAQANPPAGAQQLAPPPATDTTISRPARQGEFNRRKRALQLRGNLFGTAGSGAEGEGAADTTRFVADSTARIQQFVHVPVDAQNAAATMQRTHPLYVAGPTKAKTTVELDTTTWMYTVRYLLGADDIRSPVILPFDDYVSLKLDYAIRRNWEQILQTTAVQVQRKQGLGELFGKVTNIEIPVPKNPIFSIFGPNIIRLQINGRVDIHAAFRNTQNDQFVNSPLGQTRNEPDFNQEVQITLRGDIGDKLNISADWNTQRTFEYENQLKVQYKGYEDEIVQSVQAGNVSLPTSSSFIPPSQALFGILAKFQFGPLNLTTVASQKKGQIKELSVSGGARPTPFDRRPTDYSKDHFFIDTAYISLYENIYFSIPAQPDPNLQIQEIEVWISSQTSFDAKDRDVAAFMSLDSVFLKMNDDNERTKEYETAQGLVEVGKFTQLQENIDFTYNASAGIISIDRSLQNDQAVAVAFTVQGQTAPVQIGNFGSRDTATSRKLIMKLVRPRNLQPQFTTAWRLQLKNRYSLGGRGIKKDGFEFKVEYAPPGESPLQNVLPQNVNLLEMFGLDRFKEDGVPGRDESFDYLPGITIDESRGEIIFPTVEPFRASSIEKLLIARGFTPSEASAAADSFAFHAIYDTTYNGAVNDRRNLFRFVGNITPSTASTYNLGFNIVEGSVEVLVDGVPATPTVDYTVDYITGIVNIRNQSLLVPGRNLQIRYEANDLFQLASKSLLGARGELKLSKEANVGFTILNLNQQSLSDKVRLGEEPISNTIMGFDGGVTLESPGLTKVLNWLPGIQTLATSTIVFKGEAAYMSPDPNTRKSPIPQDGGQGIAYIDDFEGARRIIPLGVASTAWRDMGLPFLVLGLDPFTPLPGADSTFGTNDPLITSQLLPDSTKMAFKAKASWFNIANSDVFVQDIWGDRRSVSRREEQVQVLNIFFRPAERGMYNTSLAIDSTVRSQPAKSWGGLQRLLSTTATNLLDENISFVEMWLRVVEADPGTRMHIDLGYITEDVIPNRQLDTEDGLDGGIRNGILNPSVEDVGLDAAADGDEQVRYANFVAKYPEYAGDPSGDNWRRIDTYLERVLDVTSALGFEGYTGVENNKESELGARFPDTEDLNGNNILDRVNSYYEYDIPLDTLDPGFRRFVVGGGENGWYQVRIPLNKYSRQIGSPSFTNIEGVRVWMTGASTDALIRITEFNLIGNQWEELVKNDPSFKVSTVNFEDNPSYEIPPGVRRERDRTRPDEEIYGNEQSLNLVLTDVPDGESRQAIKRFPIRPLDLFNYKVMKMFVHGESRPGLGFMYADTSSYDAEVFIRFGADSLNYYEYRSPIRPGWDPLNDVTIRFSDLSAIKLLRDSARGLTSRFPVEGGPIGATYQIRGEPTLNRITYISIGVENPESKGRVFLTGEVWINELRLTDVDDTPGWAYRFDTQVRLADVASIQFSLQNRDPFFHGLEERFGSRQDRTDWTLSASIGFEKFLPESWKGTALGFSYSHVENMQRPRYMPGTDILVEEAAAQIDSDTSTTRTRIAETGEDLRIRTQELSVTETYSVPSIRLSIPVDAWYISETINRMTFGFSYTENTRRSPTIEFSKTWSWNARFAYALPLGQENYMRPLFLFESLKDWRVHYLPKQISLGTTFTRNQARSQARNQVQQNPINRNFGANRDFSFNWQLTENGLLSPALDYQVNIGSNLTHLEIDELGNQRPFSDIVNSLFLGDRLISFGNDIQYAQTINVMTRPKVPTFLDLDKILTPSFRYNVRYNWTRNIQAGDLGRSASWNGSITMGLDVNVKTIGDQIWPAVPAAPAVPIAEEDSVPVKKSPLDGLLNLTRVLIKEPLFGFDRFNISFTQTNRSQNGGVLGRPGFGNLFARVPFFQSSLEENGPSLLYQLGLASDPHGDVVVGTSGSFPFIRGGSVRGRRAPNGNLTDVYNQSNKVSMRTSRQLWQGAQLDLTWNLGWSYNSSSTVITDSLGIPTVRSRTISGDVDRSFISLPPVLVFKFFKTSVEEVYKRFDELRTNGGDVRPDEEKIAQAFEEGFEAFPFLTKLFGGLLPRANWSFRMDGLENLPLFNAIASRVSLDHAYTSNFRRRWRISPQGQDVTEGETVSYGFAPLAGLNFTFKGIEKGNLGAQVRYSTTTSFDLSPSIQNIVEATTEEVSVTANFSRQGFEFPLFGLSLSNDLQASLSYAYSRNKRRLFDLKQDFKEEGQPLEGSSRTTIEPRIRYILSSRVTASLYYRYVKTAPDEGGSKITGTTVNEGGLDINVAIQ